MLKSAFQSEHRQIKLCFVVCSFIKHLDMCSTPKCSVNTAFFFLFCFLVENKTAACLFRRILLSASLFLCFSLRQVNLSQNQLTSLPSGLLHLTRIQKISAAKNQLTVLFDIPDGMFPLTSNCQTLRKLDCCMKHD